jgi:hypothetical protein
LLRIDLGHFFQPSMLAFIIFAANGGAYSASRKSSHSDDLQGAGGISYSPRHDGENDEILQARASG